MSQSSAHERAREHNCVFADTFGGTQKFFVIARSASRRETPLFLHPHGTAPAVSLVIRGLLPQPHFALNACQAQARPASRCQAWRGAPPRSGCGLDSVMPVWPLAGKHFKTVSVVPSDDLIGDALMMSLGVMSRHRPRLSATTEAQQAPQDTFFAPLRQLGVCASTLRSSRRLFLQRPS
jgi:hypothetical protein